MEKTSTYNWQFKPIGGTSRIAISSGEDLKHLEELDQKLWTVLSCPSSGLEFDQKTLDILDSNKDGRINVGEVVAAADYLTSVIKDADKILLMEDSLALDELILDNPDGKRLHDSAKQILENLGLQKDSISLADTADSIAIFAKTKFNGDGVITPASTDDEALKSVIGNIISCTGGAPDRSGEQGVTAEQIEAFYTACNEWSAWTESGKDSAKLPYGDNTEAALAAVNAIADKVNDYFMRCKLATFDSDSAAALDVQVARISEISAHNLAQCVDEIAAYPLARISAGSSSLPYDGINPAWQAAFARFKELVLDFDCPGKDSLDETEWLAICGKFEAYTAWKGSKKGESVEALGTDRVAEILNGDGKAALLALVEQDKALEAEANSIEDVDKLLHLYRYFYSFLRNYITMEDFFAKDKLAIFQAGSLFLDQRCLKLCVRVSDMSKHGDMAGLSGMYILYCKCESKAKGKSMDIAAVLTDGDVDHLRVGTNGIFYDRDGVDYNATITKIVENPVSIRQAFWSPYKKFARTITDRINKSAAEKESKVSSELTNKAATAQIPTTEEGKAAAQAAAPKAPFDIAKIAGIFAAFGMAAAFLASALAKLVRPWYTPIIVLFVLVVLISGPSMFIAWQKLRKRNLAPVLNANGWAINASILVGIMFGAKLTDLAKFPALESVDPKAASKKFRRKVRNNLIIILLIAVAGAGIWWKISSDRNKKADKECVEAVSEEAATGETEVLLEPEEAVTESVTE